jgi:septal ring factor EnvC (AmiA/AmiB activator)
MGDIDVKALINEMKRRIGEKEQSVSALNHHICDEAIRRGALNAEIQQLSTEVTEVVRAQLRAKDECRRRRAARIPELADQTIAIRTQTNCVWRRLDAAANAAIQPDEHTEVAGDPKVARLGGIVSWSTRLLCLFIFLTA